MLLSGCCAAPSVWPAASLQGVFATLILLFFYLALDPSYTISSIWPPFHSIVILLPIHTCQLIYTILFTSDSVNIDIYPYKKSYLGFLLKKWALTHEMRRES